MGRARRCGRLASGPSRSCATTWTLSTRARTPLPLPRPGTAALLNLGGAAAAAIIALLAGAVLGRLGNADDQLKAILLGVTCVGLVVAALRPRFGFALVAALLPFQFKATAGGFSIGTNELLLFGLAIALAPRIRWPMVPRWFALGSIAVLAGGLASIVVAEDPGAAAWGVMRWAAAITLAFAAFGVFAGDPATERRLADIMCGAGVIVVLFAILQNSGVNVIAGPPFLAGLPDSTFGYYTVYAGFAAMVATLAIGELLTAISDRRQRRAAAYGFALAIYIVGVGISLSRGGLLALGAGMVTFLVLVLPRGSVVLRLALVLAVFAGAGVLATPEQTREDFRARFQVQNQAQVQDDLIRSAYQEAGRQALASSPLGIGYANYSDYVGRRFVTAQTKAQAFHSHNLVVQMGLDAGWLGLAGFLVVVGTPVAWALRLSVSRALSVRSAAFTAALIGVLAQGLFDYLFHEIASLAFFVALVWALARLLRSDHDRARVAAGHR